MRSRIIIIIFTIFIIDIGLCQSYKIDTFDQYYKIVNELETNQQYQEAILLTKSLWNQFPEHKFDLIKELEYLHEKTGQYKDNLDLWSDGHDEGYFFLLNRQIKKYEPYLSYTRFDTLVKKDSELRNKTLETSKTIYEVQ